MKTKIAKDFTSYEIYSGFKNTVICSIVLFVFGFLTIAFGKHAYEYFYTIGYCEFIAGAVLIIYGILTLNIRKRRFYVYMQSYSFCVEQLTKTAVETFVDPMVILTIEGEVKWCNEAFMDMIGREPRYGEYIQDIFNDFSIEKYRESFVNVVDDYEYNSRSFRVTGRAVRSTIPKAEEVMIGLYFDDVSEIKELQQKFKNKSIVECLVIIDNYDEVIKVTPNSNHGTLMGEVEKCVNSWVTRSGGVSRRYEREKFIVYFEHKEYRDIIEKEKYAILDEVRNINLENKIPITLSIGTGIEGESLEEIDKMANLALEMALGRGGDQVVVKSPNGYNFYGAKTREVEKSTKVKARVMAHALRQAIDEASRVFIMGHKNSDMDSVGAAIGLFQAIKSRDVETYIILKKGDSNAKLLLNNFVNDPEYVNNIITGEKALTLIDKQTLLIIVDTHRRLMVEYEEVLNAAKNIVLIDHHRRSEDFIDNAILKYHEPFASSACEMVTEILQYIQDNPKINIREAEALYAGIYLDTKGFTFKTGVRTFEAAAYLRRMGVDPVNIRRLFKNDINESVRMSKIISSARVYRDNIAIVKCDDTGKDLQVMVAKAADELLNIDGIEASFVVAKLGNKIIISGRSLESINVQIILEKLGGGGHITIAGAQLSDQDMDFAVEKLKEAIDSVLED